MASSLALIKLLQQLLKRNYRQDPSFDKYQLRFLKKLQSSPSEETDIELFDECNQQLEVIPNDLEESLSEGRLVVNQSQLQLLRLQGLSTDLIDKVKGMQQQSKPYTLKEHHIELKTLIKIYQRAVIELNKNSETEAHPEQPNIESLNAELQQLILELDVNKTHAKKLEKIRVILSNQMNPSALPHYCLSIINIIIESTREERRASRHFMYSLNDSLTEFYLNFSKTAKMAKVEFKEQDDAFSSIQEQAMRLKENSQSAKDLDSLRKTVTDYANNLQNLLKEKDQRNKQQFRHKFQGMVRQIKELQNETKSYQQTLKQQRKQMHIDFLTKIPNRAAWSERLEIEVSRFKRHQNSLIMAVIDIDSFKKINDTYGHLAGDKVLNVIAQTLQKSIRNTDFIARFGGEEFTLLLPDTSQKQATQVLEKLCKLIETIPFKFKKEALTVTVSIGFTQYSINDDIDDAFGRADKALYHAKNNGKNQVSFIGRIDK